MKINKHVRALSSDGVTVAKVMATFCVVLAHSHKLLGYMEVEDAVYFLRGVKALGYCSVPVFFLFSGYFLIFTGGVELAEKSREKDKKSLNPVLHFYFGLCIDQLFWFFGFAWFF